MRLTINLDDDLYALARSLARDNDCTIGSAVNQLLRRRIEAQSAPASADDGTGLPSVPTSRTFGSDDVARLDLDSP